MLIFVLSVKFFIVRCAGFLNFSFVKEVDWLAAGIALRVVGAVLVIFLRRWHKIFTILQPMGRKGVPEDKPCWQIRSKDLD
jgi:hypothetical protein